MLRRKKVPSFAIYKYNMTCDSAFVVSIGFFLGHGNLTYFIMFILLDD